MKSDVLVFILLISFFAGMSLWKAFRYFTKRTRSDKTVKSGVRSERPYAGKNYIWDSANRVFVENLEPVEPRTEPRKYPLIVTGSSRSSASSRPTQARNTNSYASRDNNSQSNRNLALGLSVGYILGHNSNGCDSGSGGSHHSSSSSSGDSSDYSCSYDNYSDTSTGSNDGGCDNGGDF